MSAHPFLFPFATEDRWISYLESCLRWQHNDIAKAKILLRRKIIPVLRGPELGIFLGVSPKLVCRMVLAAPRYYSAFKIKKKNGEYREINAPRVFLKTVQRYILDCVLGPVKPHKCAVGFRRSFSPATGAERHVGHKFVWNIDLRDFFPSIKKEMVTTVFEKIGLPHKGAYFLAGLCCLEGKLPQGAPTSPALANLVFIQADRRIANLAQKHGITYTRYADDLTFSYDEPIDPAFRKTVTEMVGQLGFSINTRKTRLMGPRCRREVTGLTVNEKVSIPRTVRRKLRAMFHKVSQNPEEFADAREKLLGFASWVSVYHPADGSRYRDVALRIPFKEIQKAREES